QVKRQKGAAHVKRGVIFTKGTKESMLAAREGGGDPDANFRLRLALDRARAVNMPRDNIQRAIDRATGGGDAAALESVVYEGYAPGGVSVMIEAATDNRNRTVSEIRAALAMRPTTTVRGEGDQARKVINLVETLEDLDDVQRVHANFDVPDEVLEHA